MKSITIAVVLFCAGCRTGVCIRVENSPGATTYLDGNPTTSQGKTISPTTDAKVSVVP